MFFIKGTYVKDIEEVERELSNHYKYLDKYFAEKKFILAGRRVPRTGGVILCNAKDREEVEAILQEDPFCQKNIMEFEIIEFTPTKYLNDIEGLIS